MNRATLPMVLYARNDQYSASEFTDLISHRNVVAMKYASPDIARLSERIAAAALQDVMMMCGLAETWAPPFYAAGATGFTSGLVNVLPALSLEVRRRPYARQRTRRAGALVSLSGFGGAA